MQKRHVVVHVSHHRSMADQLHLQRTQVGEVLTGPCSIMRLVHFP